jgi:hypothetical protein
MGADMTPNLKVLGFVTIALVTGQSVAHASLVTSIPGGTLLSVPAVEFIGEGPETVAPGVTWSSNTNSLYGYDKGFTFGANGAWGFAVGPMEGLNTTSGTMTFQFSTPVSAVGGLINWAGPGGFGPTNIAVYNSSNQLIENVVLDDGSSNLFAPNSFYGFSDSTNDIAYFTLTGGYIGITDLTVSTATPLPAALPLFATGLGAMGLFGWRRKRQHAQSQIN